MTLAWLKYDCYDKIDLTRIGYTAQLPASEL
jgi:hypothetical protein